MNPSNPFDLTSLVLQIDEALRWPRTEESIRRAQRLAKWIVLSSPSSEIADVAMRVIDAAEAIDVHAEYPRPDESHVKDLLSELEEADLETKAVSAR